MSHQPILVQRRATGSGIARALLLLLAISLCFVIGFTYLGTEVREPATTSTDQQILRNVADRTRPWPLVLPETASLFGTAPLVVVITAVVGASLARERRWPDIALLIVAVVGAVLLSPQSGAPDRLFPHVRHWLQFPQRPHTECHLPRPGVRVHPLAAVLAPRREDRVDARPHRLCSLCGREPGRPRRALPDRCARRLSARHSMGDAADGARPRRGTLAIPTLNPSPASGRGVTLRNVSDNAQT